MTELTIVATVVTVVFGGVSCYIAWMLGQVVRDAAAERADLERRLILLADPEKAVVMESLESPVDLKETRYIDEEAEVELMRRGNG